MTYRYSNPVTLGGHCEARPNSFGIGRQDILERSKEPERRALGSLVSNVVSRFFRIRLRPSNNSISHHR